MDRKKIRFIFSPQFKKEWIKSGLELEQLLELKNQILQYLQSAPDNNFGKSFPGSIIVGTGGAIKYRFTPDSSSKGKSGSYRTIYFVYSTATDNLYFLTVYPKNKKASLTNKEKNLIKQFIEVLKKRKD